MLSPDSSVTEPSSKRQKANGNSSAQSATWLEPKSGLTTSSIPESTKAASLGTSASRTPGSQRGGSRHKYPQPQEQIRNGPLDHEEVRIVEQIVRDYRDSQHLSQAELNESFHKIDSHSFHMLSVMIETLRNRTRRALMRFCQRHYHNYSRGSFTDEEDRTIIKCQAERPDQWVWIAAQVDRLPGDCRDRWKDYLRLKNERKTHEWSAEEEARLLEAMKSSLEQLQEMGPVCDGMSIYELRPDDVSYLFVSNHVGTRNRLQCRKRWQTLCRQKENVDNGQLPSARRVSSQTQTPRSAVSTGKKQQKLTDSISRPHQLSSSEAAATRSNQEDQKTADQTPISVRYPDAHAKLERLESMERQISAEGSDGPKAQSLQVKQLMVGEMREIAATYPYTSRTAYWSALEELDHNPGQRTWTNVDRKALARALKKAGLLNKVTDVQDWVAVQSWLTQCIKAQDAIKPRGSRRATYDTPTRSAASVKQNGSGRNGSHHEPEIPESDDEDVNMDEANHEAEQEGESSGGEDEYDAASGVKDEDDYDFDAHTSTHPTEQSQDLPIKGEEANDRDQRSHPQTTIRGTADGSGIHPRVKSNDTTDGQASDDAADEDESSSHSSDSDDNETKVPATAIPAMLNPRDAAAAAALRRSAQAGSQAPQVQKQAKTQDTSQKPRPTPRAQPKSQSKLPSPRKIRDTKTNGAQDIKTQTSSSSSSSPASSSSTSVLGTSASRTGNTAAATTAPARATTAHVSIKRDVSSPAHSERAGSILGADSGSDDEESGSSGSEGESESESSRSRSGSGSPSQELERLY